MDEDITFTNVKCGNAMALFGVNNKEIDFKSRAIAAIKLLKNYQFLFNYQNVDILAENVPESFPKEWIDYFATLSTKDIHNLGTGLLKDDAPESLKNFFYDLNKAIVNIPVLCENDQTTRKEFQAIEGMCVKKNKEVACLAYVTKEIYQISDSNIIIDIGTGLGYLAFKLFKDYGFKVLGIEGDAKKYELALSHQEKYYPDSKNNVFFAHHFIKEDSANFISSLIKEVFKDVSVPKCAFTGLHACADLSINILKIFAEMEEAKAIAIMPCCYHKMQEDSSTATNKIFLNFPVLVCGQIMDAFIKENANDYLRIPYLRLACQQTGHVWKKKTPEEVENQGKNLMFRCLLEKVAREGGFKVCRKKRKTGQNEANKGVYNFETFVQNLDSSFKILNNVDYVKCRLLELWEEKGDLQRFFEALNALQTVLQPLCEQLVLFDRISYLKDLHGDCFIVRIADPDVTPRNLALICYKQHKNS